MAHRQNLGRNFKKFLEANDDGGTTFQNRWATMKAALRGKVRATNVHIKIERSPIINLIIDKQYKSGTNKRKESMEMRGN